MGINPGTKTPIEIIGVVKDAKYTGVRDEIPRQVFFAFLENDFAGGSVMYVRTSNRPEAAFGSIREVMHQLDPNIPMYNPRTRDSQIDQSLLNDRLIATLSAAFGALATLRAVIGLYGVMAFTVARRTRSQLYGVTASDPSAMAGAAALLLAVALLAGYLPARRATRVNPVLALRYE